MKFLLILFILVILVIILSKRNCPFPISTIVSSKFFELIHVDIWTPHSIPSFEGHQFVLTVVDDFSRFTWIYLLKTKVEVKFVVPNFILLIQNQFPVKLKKWRSDNGREFFLTNFLPHMESFMRHLVLKLLIGMALLRENLSIF